MRVTRALLPRRAGVVHCSAPVTPSKRRTPPEQQAVDDDDVVGPTSAVRARLPMSAVPCLAVTVEGLRFLPLDARTAYLISLVDGHCTVEAILDICESELRGDEALALLARLLQLGAIELRGPRVRPA